MSRPDIHDHELRLTAATLAALFFIEQSFLWPPSIVTTGLALLCLAWFAYEWRLRLRLRRRRGIARIARLPQIARTARENPANSRMVAAFVCAAIFVLIGELASSARGGLIGMGCGLAYVLIALLAERYPPR
jgi:hypothetical protein